MATSVLATALELDLARHAADQRSLARRDPTRLQRAPEGPDESLEHVSAWGCDDPLERRARFAPTGVRREPSR